jgi:hypothetical protein
LKKLSLLRPKINKILVLNSKINQNIGLKKIKLI